MQGARPRTVAVHGGRRPTPADPDVVPPLRRATTFLQHKGTFAATDGGDWDGPLVYSRYKNPTVEEVEGRLAALEGAEDAVLFASGIAALHAVLTAAVPSGRGRVALARQIYGGTDALLAGPLGALGFETVHFDVEDPSDLERALATGVDLVHCEGISNPTALVADLREIADAAHAHGVPLSVDSTFATPTVQRPLEHGADWVVHSATKALGGHSDLTAGVVLGSSERIESVQRWRRVAGAILDPSAAWLLGRSLCTLELRVRAQCENAARLAAALEGRAGVARVHYPGLESHRSHALAGRMLSPGLFGSVLSFELEAGDEATRPFVSRLGVATDAPSLGGVETLVSIPAYMSHVALGPEGRAAAGIGPGCVRVAAGIEDPEDLVADFLGALG
ncbi:MAG: aminotransferase class I/II-fold pyridoxal phosphate-dependent enzyme [Planctomycetota bacterium]